jgi:dihydrofolate reductase
MRKVVVSEMVSLDGFFEDAHHELGWQKLDEELFEHSREMLNAADTLLFGRVTFQIMAAYWPDSDDDAVITHKMNYLSKIVFSHTLKKVDWNNSRVAGGNPEAEVARLKKEAGNDMLIFGSGKLVSQLAKAGLVDEYRLAVNPVVLGDGYSLFKGAEDPFTLDLIRTKVLKSGVVILYYRPGNTH